MIPILRHWFLENFKNYKNFQTCPKSRKMFKNEIIMVDRVNLMTWRVSGRVISSTNLKIYFLLKIANLIKMTQFRHFRKNDIFSKKIASVNEVDHWGFDRPNNFYSTNIQEHYRTCDPDIKTRFEHVTLCSTWCSLNTYRT